MELPALRENRLLSKMRAGESVHVLMMGTLTTPALVDAVCASGLVDVLWFDLEHAPQLMTQLAVLGMVARPYPVSTLARIQPVDYGKVMYPLEAGLDGLVVPMVESRRQAEDVVKWAKFNLGDNSEVRGIRGWNGGSTDGAYGFIDGRRYAEHQNRQTTIVLQVESPAGIDCVEEIASVPGVDGIFLGTGDFSHRIGQVGNTNVPETRRAMERVAQAAKKAGMWWGMPVVTRERYEEARRLGAQFLHVCGEVTIFRRGIESTRQLLNL